MSVSWKSLNIGSYIDVANKRCQYFNSLDVNDVVGYLPIGKYVARSITNSPVSNFTWIEILVSGKSYYTAYLKDRMSLYTNSWISYQSEGIDVSKFQGTVDWDAVKSAGYEFALIRVVSTSAADGLYIDPCFASNIANAKAAGLKIGVYIYTYALDEAYLNSEIDLAISAMGTNKFDYPIFLDYEDSSIQVTGKAGNTALFLHGAQRLLDAGYYPGLYSGKYWSENYIDAASLSQFPFWLAHYTIQTDSTLNYGIWQYGGATVPGVTSGACDVDHGYIDWEPYINWNGYNKIAACTPYTPDAPVEPTTGYDIVSSRICPHVEDESYWTTNNPVLLYGEMAVSRNVGIKYGDGISMWSELGYENDTSENVQSDWNQLDITADDYIKNKPTSMPASDVYAWAKASTKPTYTKLEVGLGNADNTSDANKPISTAAQTALNDKESLIKNADAKTSIVDADTLPISDSASSSATKKVTFAIIKATLKSYFDTLYNKYVLPVATSSSLGGVKSGTDITVDGSGNVSVNDDSHNHVIGNVDGLESALDGKLLATGNAVSATKLQTARKIAGTLFDGSADISISYNNLADKPTIPSGVTVTNNLTSTSTTSSLSANMGRELNEKKANKTVISQSQPTGQIVGDTWEELL